MDILDRIIKENIDNLIIEYTEPSSYNQQMSLNEMARINKRETGKCIFPYNSWELKIWSNDRNPPHFHIIKDGWNVSFDIENGTVVNIESRGTENGVYDYMIANVTRWLKSQCSALPKITNQENAMLQWGQIHDN